MILLYSSIYLLRGFSASHYLSGLDWAFLNMLAKQISEWHIMALPQANPLIDISIARVNPSYLKIQLNFILPYLQVIILARIISSWQDLDLRFKTQCSSKSFCKVTTQWVCLIIQNLKKECHPVQDLSSSYATF